MVFPRRNKEPLWLKQKEASIKNNFEKNIIIEDWEKILRVHE